MDKAIILCCFCGSKYSLRKIESHIKNYCVKTVEVILEDKIIISPLFTDLFYKIDKGDFNMLINIKFIEKFNKTSGELFSDYMKKVKNKQMTRVYQQRLETSKINSTLNNSVITNSNTKREINMSLSKSNLSNNDISKIEYGNNTTYNMNTTNTSLIMNQSININRSIGKNEIKEISVNESLRNNTEINYSNEVTNYDISAVNEENKAKEIRDSDLLNHKSVEENYDSCVNDNLIKKDDVSQLKLENVELIPNNINDTDNSNIKTKAITSDTNNTAKIFTHNNTKTNSSISINNSKYNLVDQSNNITLNQSNISNSNHTLSFSNYMNKSQVNYMCLDYLYKRFSGIKINQIKEIEGLMCFICGRKLAISNLNPHLKTCSVINSYLLEFAGEFPEFLLSEILEVLYNTSNKESFIKDQDYNEKIRRFQIKNSQKNNTNKKSKSPNTINNNRYISNNSQCIKTNLNNKTSSSNKIEKEDIDLDYLNYLISEFNTNEMLRHQQAKQMFSKKKKKIEEDEDDKEIMERHTNKNKKRVNMFTIEDNIDATNNISHIPDNVSNNLLNETNQTQVTQNQTINKVVNNMESLHMFEYKLSKALTGIENKYSINNSSKHDNVGYKVNKSAKEIKDEETRDILNQGKEAIASKYSLPASLKLIKCFICWKDTNITGLKTHFTICRGKFFKNNPGKHLNIPKTFPELLIILEEYLKCFNTKTMKEELTQIEKAIQMELDKIIIKYMIEAEVHQRELVLVNCEKCWRKFNPQAYEIHIKNCKSYEYNNNKIKIQYKDPKQEKVSLRDFSNNKKIVDNMEKALKINKSRSVIKEGNTNKSITVNKSINKSIIINKNKLGIYENKYDDEFTEEFSHFKREMNNDIKGYFDED